MNLLDIKNPKFLKNLNTVELNTLAKDISDFLVSNITKHGGHLSSNLGTIELTIALHKVFDITKNKFLFDVGHQSYTHKILTGRASSFNKIRQPGGISGFQSFEESLHDHLDAGHSGTALGFAAGYTYDSKIKNVITVIGDASFMNGVSLESLVQLKHISNKRHIIIVNDNQMSIAPTTGSIVENNNFIQDISKAIKFNYLLIKDGHSIESLIKIFSEVDNSKECYIIHVITKKGNQENKKYLDIDGSLHGVNIQQKTKWSEQITRVLEDYLKESQNNFLICPGTILSSGVPKNKYSNQIKDVGISESLSLLFACGLQKIFKNSFVLIYSTFLQRAFDQIIHDVSRLKIPILVNIQNCGLVGSDGSSHQGLYDLNFLYGVPNINIFHPSNIEEFQKCVKWHFQKKLPTFIRTEKFYEYKNWKIKTEKFMDFWQIYNHKNYDTLVISYGNCWNTVVENYYQNTEITLINAILLNNLDEKKVTNFLAKFKKVYVFEENFEKTGLFREIKKFYFYSNIESIGISFEHVGYQENDKILNLLQNRIKNII